MILIGEKLGRQNYYDYQRDFGFGEITGIDLPGEESVEDGIYKLEELNPVEIATGTMGQSFSTTPIQTLTAFTSLINGGYLLEPYVVSRVVNSNHEVVYSHDRVVKRQVVSRKTSDYLRKAMRQTVTDGTGKKVNIDGYTIGGKTGTAQQGVRSLNEHVLSFAGYFPVENPQYTILTTVYKPRPYVNGVSTGTLMAKDVIEYIIQIKGIEPSSIEELEDASLSLTNKVKVPDFSGMSIVNATKYLNNQGFSYEVIGTGSKVNHTVPNAGSFITKGSYVYLYAEAGENDELVLLPNVTGLTGLEAEKILKDAGFEVTLFKKTPTGGFVDETTTTEDIREGIVKKQMPSDNTNVPAGTYIRLEIASK